MTSVENVVMRTNDTDVFILLLYHVHKLDLQIGVWMDVGLSSLNTRRYLDVKRIAGTLSDELLRSLPGFHSFTGCDTTAAFINKGKLRPFDLLEKSDEFLKWFGELGEFYPPSQEVFDGIEKFVCVLYGRGRESRVNMLGLIIPAELCT